MSCAKILNCCLLSLLVIACSQAQTLPATGQAIIDWQIGQPTSPMVIQHSGKVTDLGIQGTVNDNPNETAFITTPVGLLDAHRRYQLSVTYRVLESPADSDHASARGFFAMRTSTPNTTWVPSTWIREAVGDEHTRTINYLLPEGVSGYTLNIGVEQAGKLLVTAVKFLALPRFTDDVKRDTANLPTPDFKGRSFEPFGICQHLPWPYFYKTDEQIKQAIVELKQLGVQTARTGINWSNLQPKNKDEWSAFMTKRYDTMINSLSEAGIKNHIILGTSPQWNSSNPEASDFWRYMPKDLDALREYVRFVTRRWGKQIDSYEITNEPDLKGFWKSSIEDYMTWAKVAVEVIREEDPTAVILSGSLTDAGLWGLKGSDSFALQTMIDNGFGKTFDGLAVHTYTPQIELAVYQINHWYSQLVAAGLGHMPIWITETGRSTFTSAEGVTTTDEDQAESLHRTYSTLTQHPAVEKIFWYNFREKEFAKKKNKPREGGFGLVCEDFSHKPAYDVYRDAKRPSAREDNLQLLAVDRKRLVKP
ncbi:MAG TPA: hypothetical protein DER01_07580 [Phycisphaerales bacterium]|nr:hypothetical protein [Phycisphaerales bacterium]